jgi:hypothetical protein
MSSNRSGSRPGSRSGTRSRSGSRSNNNVYVNGRNAEGNFVGNVEQGEITGNNALSESALLAQLNTRNLNGAVLPKASRIKSQWVIRRPAYNHYVSIQQSDAMREGTICMIDKNGECVPVGHTDPQYTTRTTESMRREYQEIMNDPATTLPDIQRARQLLRMIHIREASEYLERERLRRERSTRTRLYNLLRNGSRSFRGLFSRRRANERRPEERRANERRSTSRSPGGTRRP